MRNHWKTTEMEAILQSSYSSVPNNKWGVGLKIPQNYNTIQKNITE